MSKAAARLGDNTAHGGAIMAGALTVLIGGKPAARQGDMHTCPLVNPGVPPPPHVGGPAILGSPTVLICGQMALRMGDMVQCSGPPDSVVVGCPTVLIGEGGAGGGGGAGPAGAAASAALAGSDPDSDEDHFLDVNFTDKKGNPIKGVKYDLKRPDGKQIKGTLGGKLRKTGVPEGNYDVELKAITSAKWSKKQARDGESVKMLIEVAGIEDGTKATIEIYEKNVKGPDQCIESVSDLSVSGGKLESEWEYIYEEDMPVTGDVSDDDWEAEEDAGEVEERGYYAPSYFFVARIGDSTIRSPILEYKDFIELSLADDDDQPAKNARFKVFLSNGEVREGTLDDSGYKKVENVPPGKWRVEFPDFGIVDED